MAGRLEGKVAVVTGGAGGIGKALAWRFIDEGARGVVVADLEQADPGAVAEELGNRAVPFAGDIFDAAFKANTRNLALLARYQLDPIGSRRSSRFFVLGFSLLLALVVAFVIAVPVLVIVALFKLF